MFETFEWLFVIQSCVGFCVQNQSFLILSYGALLWKLAYGGLPQSAELCSGLFPDALINISWNVAD